MADTPLPPDSNESETSPSGAPIYRYEGLEPAPFRLASGDNDTIAAISAHIERHIGPISGVMHEVVSDQVHLDVHVVPPTTEFPFYTLVTSGMSDQPMLTPAEADPEDAPPYAELCILLPSTWPLPDAEHPMQEVFEDEDVYWPVRWLKMLARLPHEYFTWLGFGHTIPNGEEAHPFASNTHLGCLLLLTAISLPEEFQRLQVSPTKTIQFYTLYPLYPEEMELKMNLGVNTLIDRFEEFDIRDVVDLNRPNVALP